MCIAIATAPVRRRRARISPDRSPSTSFTTSAPASIAFAATSAWRVSTERGTEVTAARRVRTGAILAHSASGETAEAPGRVDSPPTSIRSAPSRTSCSAWATAASGSRNRPPSENESGVTFTTPITRVRSPVVDRAVGTADGPDPARHVRAQRAFDLVRQLGEPERLATELREEVEILAPRRDQHDRGRARAVVRDPPCVGRVAPDGEDLLLEQGRRLQRYAVEPDGIDQPFSGHDPDPLGVAPGRLQLAGHLGERRPVEHAGGEPVTGRGRRHGNREPARDKKAPGGAKAAVAAPRTATRVRFAPRMVGSEGSVSARPVVVSVDGPSAAGKSTVVARAAALFGWVPLAEAFDRIDPAPDLRFSSDRELEELERTLLEEDARRYRNALSLRATGLTVVTDTGFLGPLTYTAGLVALGRASPTGAAADRRAGAGAGTTSERGGVPDVVVTWPHPLRSVGRGPAATGQGTRRTSSAATRRSAVGRNDSSAPRCRPRSREEWSLSVPGRGATLSPEASGPRFFGPSHFRPGRAGRDVLGLFAAPAERADPEEGRSEFGNR